MYKKPKDITDAQVLAQLKVRRLRLKAELERVEMAIRAFEDIKDIDPLDMAIYEAEDLESPSTIQEDLAVSILMYNPKMSAEKKILYVLGRIGKPSTAQEITEYLVKVDGHIKHVELVFNNITYVASRMYKSGKLLANRVGKKNLYYLRS